MASTQAILVAGSAISPSSVLASDWHIKKLLLTVFFGVREAYAATADTSNIFLLNASNEINALDLIQSIDPNTGARTTVSRAKMNDGSAGFLVPKVTGIFDAKNFVLMAFDDLFKPNASGVIDRNDANTLCPILALRKSDGANYCIAIKPWCKDFSNCAKSHGNTSIQANEDGTLIFIQDESNSIRRVNLKDPRNIQINKVVDAVKEGFTQSMIVNASGDAYLDIATPGVDFKNVMKIYRVDGSQQMLSTNQITAESDGGYGVLSARFVNCPFHGTSRGANQDNFFFADESFVLKKLSKQSSGVFVESVLYGSGLNWSQNLMKISDGGNCYRMVAVGDYVYSIANLNQEKSYVTEVLNPSLSDANGAKLPRRLDFGPSTTFLIDIVGYSDGFVVLGKDNVLIRYTIANNTKTVILNDRSITVDSYGALLNGDVKVVGSKSDGTRFLGTIDHTTNALTIDKKLAASVSQLITLK